MHLFSQAEVSSETIANIFGSGHTVRYQTSDERNAWLGGKSYRLPHSDGPITANINRHKKIPAEERSTLRFLAGIVRYRASKNFKGYTGTRAPRPAEM
jgi:hypothetical protein